MTNAGTSEARSEWRELNLFRGLAGLCMVVNHAGVKLLSPEVLASHWVGKLVTLGSAAPVLYFAATGVGYGIQNEREAGSRTHALLAKVAILLLADSLMSQGWVHLDFLGFIGLSMLFLEPLRRWRFGVAGALAGIVVALGLRFGTLLDAVAPAWIVGRPVPGVSYPLTPWIAYSFMGFTLGALGERHREKVRGHRLTVTILLMAGALLAGLLSYWLVQRGAVFFRWGSVSAAYFVFGCAVLLAMAGLAFVFSTNAWRPVAAAISLRGVTSLALVPVHFGVLGLLEHLVGGPLNSTVFLLVATIAIVASLALSRSVAQLAYWCATDARRTSSLRFGAVGAGILIALHATTELSEGTATAVMVVGQLILCVLLAVVGKPVRAGPVVTTPGAVAGPT